jgi:hypothetical protein
MTCDKLMVATVQLLKSTGRFELSQTAPRNFEHQSCPVRYSEQALENKKSIEGNISKIQAPLGSSGCSEQDSNVDRRQSLGEE